MIIKGLMFHIGEFENSLGAECCLDFLVKLLGYEFNPECEAFINLIRSSKTDFVKILKLNEHILSPKNYVQLNCFKLLKIIFDEDCNNALIINKFIQNKKSVDRFINWIHNDTVRISLLE